MGGVKLKSKFKYKGPLALYISYYLLLALSLTAAGFSFGSAHPMLWLAGGAAGIFISVSLILYTTQIERKIDPLQWRKNADTYYNDEGVFEYTHNGFSIIEKSGKSLNIRWADIVRAESGESKLNNYIRHSKIDLYFSENDFITIDSTLPGFNLFEKRLKENLRGLWKIKEASSAEGSSGTAEAKLQ
ncbi:MAG TPA: hypothetical protein VNJ07_08295 [Chitinophagales bacterium]|nr:hypothetical protein [Chitinophagales bacterium]